MAKYIKQEMNDPGGSGVAKTYYRMEIGHNMDFDEFVEHCTLHGGMQRGAIVGVLAHVAHELALQMAQGNSVTLDGLGTFRARLGVRPDKEQDSFREGEVQRNAHSIEVTGVSFRADKELVAQVDRHCQLERGRPARLHRSPLSPQERIDRARQYLQEKHFMHVADYVRLTGLSYTTASRELRSISEDPSTGITSHGAKSAKIYVLSE